MSKTALITGITGQDGSYLAEFLLGKGYHVYGLVRRSSTFNTSRIDHLLLEGSQAEHSGRFNIFRGDLTDTSSVISALKLSEPDEIYNLAAQSHVRVSFDLPIYTTEVVALGFMKLVEAVRTLDINAKIYQAGSSEMFGTATPPQSEITPFLTQSPYAVAKVAAHQFGINYRDAYGMWISNGILFNHESPRRGETFVTRKITRAIAKIKLGLQEKLVLGNLYSKRDWGFAGDYVEAMWHILQYEKPDDFVIATGKTYSVKDFVNASFAHSGFKIDWVGKGIGEKGLNANTREVLVEISPVYFRPTEVDVLLGDPTKARQALNWEPKHGFDDLVKLMIDADLKHERALLEGTKSSLKN